MKRMIIGALVMVVFIATIIMSYAVVSIPFEYIVDALTEAHVATGGSEDDVKPLFVSLLYFLAMGVIFAVLLIIALFFAYGHKEEYEQD